MMAWQDMVFSAGYVMFTSTVIPYLFDEDKPPLLISMVIAIILLMFAYSYATINFHSSAMGAFVNAVCWTVVSFQTVRKK
jgi:hypothetical protein